MRKLQAQAFSIGWPQGWTDSSTVVLIGPERPTFTPNVQVNQEPAPVDMTAAQFFAVQRQELSALDAFQVREHGDRLIASQRAEYHVITWKQNGIDVQQLQIATVRNGTLYTITCSAMPNDFKQFEGAFEMILAGFKFND
jgi:hypothetical protein